MKVVLFCGGQGLRLREFSEAVPKPMVPIGSRPILWHLMRYYAHFGHRDFVLCLGHQGDVIKSYFREYDETISNDFVLSDGGRSVELLGSDIDDWRITFASTGLATNIGQRLLAVRRFVAGEPMFLANYGDNVSDADMNEFIADFQRRSAVAAFLSVRPSYSFHIVEADGSGMVTDIEHVYNSRIRINGGFFIFRQEIFDYIREGEELVEEPFRRLIEQQQLVAYRYDGFWAPMDTLKDKVQLDTLDASGRAPWAVWSRDPGFGDPLDAAASPYTGSPSAGSGMRAPETGA
jgi:glucose-1-phosphate cytidylyltransferase